MSPSPPLGPYPQLLLWGHEGNEPTRKRIRMISSTVPIVMACILSRYDTAAPGDAVLRNPGRRTFVDLQGSGFLDSHLVLDLGYTPDVVDHFGDQ